MPSTEQCNSWQSLTNQHTQDKKTKTQLCYCFRRKVYIFVVINILPSTYRCGLKQNEAFVNFSSLIYYSSRQTKEQQSTFAHSNPITCLRLPSQLIVSKSNNTIYVFWHAFQSERETNVFSALDIISRPFLQTTSTLPNEQKNRYSTKM